MEENIIISGKTNKKTVVAIPSVFVILGIIFFMLSLTSASSIAMEDTYIVIGVIFCVLGIVSFIYLKGCQITVTDKRVFGKAAFGKRVELPFDSISAVGTSAFSGVSVATSSGKIGFVAIDNQDDVISAIRNLLIERQGKKAAIGATTIKQEVPQSNADELKKYKELLESEIITQEEFDAKKKQLLGL